MKKGVSVEKSEWASREREKTVSWERERKREESELRAASLASLTVKEMVCVKRHFIIVIKRIFF